MKIGYLLISFLFINTLVNAQCTETKTNKILLMGDSWAFFQNVDGTIRTVAKDWGHSDIDYFTNLTLSENGATTKDFLKPEKISELANQLQSKPEIKIIHLSIAGNDFLGNWKSQSFTQAQTDSLADIMISRLDSLVDTIQFLRPGIDIFWGGYVYTNFRESIEKLPSFLQSQHPFYNTWQKMEFPSAEQLNTVQNWFQNKVKVHFQSRPYFHYVHVTGLMQYEYGQIDPLGVSPGGTYPQFQAPLPEGYPEYPSPLVAMRHYAELAGVEILDCFHLSAAGFRYFNSYQFQKFYHHYFMDDAYTMADEIRTGSVSSTGNSSNVLKVGKNGDTEFVGIINLDNTHILDTGASKAQLFLRIDEIQGDNFLTNGEFKVEIVDDKFGTTSALEAVDFNAVAMASSAACVFGNPEEAGKWVRLDLDAALLPFIYKTNIQIRLKYTGSNSLITFTNSDEEDFQPILNIVYGPKSNALNTSNLDEKNVEISVFPNPTTDKLLIESKYPIDKIDVMDITGKRMAAPLFDFNQIDVRLLPQGIYFVRIQSNRQTKALKFVKN